MKTKHIAPILLACLLGSAPMKAQNYDETKNPKLPWLPSTPTPVTLKHCLAVAVKTNSTVPLFRFVNLVLPLNPSFI